VASAPSERGATTGATSELAQVWSSDYCPGHVLSYGSILQHTATHGNTLQYPWPRTATHTRHTATHCSTQQHTAADDEHDLNRRAAENGWLVGYLAVQIYAPSNLSSRRIPITKIHIPSSAVIAEERYKKIRFLLASKTKQYKKPREYK